MSGEGMNNQSGINLKIDAYMRANPAAVKGKTRQQIISIMLQNGQLSAAEVSQLSGMLSGGMADTADMGWTIERESLPSSEPKVVNQPQTEPLAIQPQETMITPSVLTQIPNGNPFGDGEDMTFCGELDRDEATNGDTFEASSTPTAPATPATPATPVASPAQPEPQVAPEPETATTPAPAPIVVPAAPSPSLSTPSAPSAPTPPPVVIQRPVKILRPDVVEDKLRTAKAKGKEEYARVFEEVYGVPYSQEEIERFNHLKSRWTIAEAQQNKADNFDKEFRHLLSDKPLEAEGLTPEQMQSEEQVGGAKQRVFAREFGRLASVMPNGEALLLQAFEENGLITLEQKYEYMKQVARAISEEQHSEAQRLSDGRGVQALRQEMYSAHTAAYGNRQIYSIQLAYKEIEDAPLEYSGNTMVRPPDRLQVFSSEVTARQQTEARNREAYALAREFQELSKLPGHASVVKMRDFIEKNITPDNICEFLSAYDSPEIKGNDISIMDTILSEYSVRGTGIQKEVLMMLRDRLVEAARKAGVPDGDINRAVGAYESGYRSQKSAPMMGGVNFLLGAIAARKVENVQEVSTADAMAATAGMAAEESQTAQATFREGRKEDGWSANLGDTVFGWFGCTTVEEMEAKLGKHAAGVKALAAAKTEEDFRTQFKELFGVEFDKDRFAAAQTALANYQQAMGLKSTIEITQGILADPNNANYTNMRVAIKEKFQLEDEVIEQIIQNYGVMLGREITTDEDKRAMLELFLKSTSQESMLAMDKLTQGRTLDDMQKELSQMNRAVFGTSDIVSEVVEFNQNMMITGMVTEAAFEIAGTIALQFVPGLGQAAAARLAVSAARWGARGVKIANAAQKAERVFSVATRVQSGQMLRGTGAFVRVGNRTGQVGAQMLTAGAATATVGLTNGHELKAVMQKTLMNMSFAGVGATSSVLSPKLMQMFKIDSRVATELSEEIINVIGSYGVSSIAEIPYEEQDAAMDMITGLIIARISHVKGAGHPSDAGRAGGITPPPVPPRQDLHSITKPDASQRQAIIQELQARNIPINKATNALIDKGYTADEIGVISTSGLKGKSLETVDRLKQVGVPITQSVITHLKKGYDSSTIRTLSEVATLQKDLNPPISEKEIIRLHNKNLTPQGILNVELARRAKVELPELLIIELAQKGLSVEQIGCVRVLQDMGLRTTDVELRFIKEWDNPTAQLEIVRGYKRANSSLKDNEILALARYNLDKTAFEDLAFNMVEQESDVAAVISKGISPESLRVFRDSRFPLSDVDAYLSRGFTEGDILKVAALQDAQVFASVDTLSAYVRAGLTTPMAMEIAPIRYEVDTHVAIPLVKKGLNSYEISLLAQLKEGKQLRDVDIQKLTEMGLYQPPIEQIPGAPPILAKQEIFQELCKAGMSISDAYTLMSLGFKFSDYITIKPQLQNGSFDFNAFVAQRLFDNTQASGNPILKSETRSYLAKGVFPDSVGLARQLDELGFTLDEKSISIINSSRDAETVVKLVGEYKSGIKVDGKEITLSPEDILILAKYGVEPRTLETFLKHSGASVKELTQNLEYGVKSGIFDDINPIKAMKTVEFWAAGFSEPELTRIKGLNDFKNIQGELVVLKNANLEITDEVVSLLNQGYKAQDIRMLSNIRKMKPELLEAFSETDVLNMSRQNFSKDNIIVLAELKNNGFEIELADIDKLDGTVITRDLCVRAIAHKKSGVKLSDKTILMLSVEKISPDDLATFAKNAGIKPEDIETYISVLDSGKYSFQMSKDIADAKLPVAVIEAASGLGIFPVIRLGAQGVTPKLISTYASSDALKAQLRSPMGQKALLRCVQTAREKFDSLGISDPKFENDLMFYLLQDVDDFDTATSIISQVSNKSDMDLLYKLAEELNSNGSIGNAFEPMFAALRTGDIDVDSYMQILSKVQTKYQDAALFDILRVLNSQERLNLFSKHLDKTTNISEFSSLCGIFSWVSTLKTGSIDVDRMLNTLLDSNLSLAQVSSLFKKLAKKDLSKVDADLFQKELSRLADMSADSKVTPDAIDKQISNIQKIASLPPDAAVLAYYKKHGGFPKANDAEMMEDILVDNEFEAQAFVNLVEAAERLEPHAGTFIIYEYVADSKTTITKIADEPPPRISAYQIMQILPHIKNQTDVDNLQRVLATQKPRTQKDKDIWGVNHAGFLTTTEIVAAVKNGGVVDSRLVGARRSSLEAKTRDALMHTLPFFSRFGNSGPIDALARLRVENPEEFRRLHPARYLADLRDGRLPSAIPLYNSNGVIATRAIGELRNVSDNVPLVRTLSSASDLQNISTLVRNGDACEFNGQLYLNVDGEPVPLKLSRENYEKLFPRGSSCMEQGRIGDCYFVAALESCLDSPRTKAAILKMFEQSGDDIIIRLPNRDEPIVFTAGRLPNAGDRHIKGSNVGLQMLEMAYGVHRLSIKKGMNIDTSDMPRLVEITKLLDALDGGGYQHVVLKDLFGHSSEWIIATNSIESMEQMRATIIQNANNPNMLLGAAIKKCATFGLYNTHAYTIKNYDPATGLVSLSNPHDTSVVHKIHIDELVGFLGTLTVFDTTKIQL